ncbi:MAG: hypothetical protein JWM65_3761 [Sphingomonas bacterium]|nr:hypothetical protein [Sphingomonas bacterium]
MGRKRIALICAALPVVAGIVGTAALAWRTQTRLAHGQVGDFCVIARDDTLAHRPGKELSVRLMLARAAIRGGEQATGPGWTLQYLSTDLLGLAFTTTAQRAAWYDSLPRCHSAGSVASDGLGNLANSARSSGPNAQRHSTNQ